MKDPALGDVEIGFSRIIPGGWAHPAVLRLREICSCQFYSTDPCGLPFCFLV